MGKTVGTTAGLDAVLGLVTRSVPMWATLFMSEFDGFHDDRAALLCKHKCVRHYPGVGSCAMMLVVNKSMQNFVKSIRWRGRCGAVHLYQAVSPTLQGFNIFCVGVHGGHGDLFSDTLADLADLLNFNRCLAKLSYSATGTWICCQRCPLIRGMKTMREANSMPTVS